MPTNFDSIAESYDRTLPEHVTRHYLMKRVNLIKRLIKEGHILDVGCGTGTLAAALKKEGYVAWGVDSSAGMVEQAKKKGIKAFVSTATALPFADEQFDMTLSVATLHHIADKEKVIKTIREMTRVTKKGGIILIWDHNPLNPYWPIIMRKVPQDTGEERLVPLKEIIKALQESGVKRIHFKRQGWVPDFTPLYLLPFFQTLELIFEHLPLVKHFSAHNIVIGRKTT